MFDISNSAIRQRAWALCRKNYMKILSITLTVSLITWIAELVLSFFAFNEALAVVASLVLAMVTTVLQFGMSLFALHIWRNESAGRGELTAMLGYIPRIIGIVLLIAAVTVVPTLATSVLATLFISMLPVYILVMIPAVVVIYWATLRISLAPLAFVMDPETKAVDCIRASWNASRGNIWRIFCNSFVLNLPLAISLALMGMFFVEDSLIYGVITLLFQTLFSGYIALGETGLGELLLTGRSMCAPENDAASEIDLLQLDAADSENDNL